MSIHFNQVLDDMLSLDDHENNKQEKFIRAEEIGIKNQIQSNEVEDCGDLSAATNSLKYYLFSKSQSQQSEQQISDNGILLDYYLQSNVASPSLEACLEEIAKFGKTQNPNYEAIHVVEVKKNKIPKAYPFSLLPSLELLKRHGTGFRRLTSERIVQQPDPNSVSSDHHRRLSTEEILRIAGARFIQSSSLTSHPFECFFSAISCEEAKDVELVELLLACAEKVGLKQHESAMRLLSLCERLSSNTGNPVQRVVYYFREALEERIDRETGRKTRRTLDINKVTIVPDAAKLAFHRGLPFSQAEKLAAAQIIAENVAQAKKVQVIDIRIGFGIHWTALMQALATRNNSLTAVELLKITALATPVSKQAVEEAGKWLSNFAYAMKIPLKFKVVMIDDVILSPKGDVFELDDDETLAVYSTYGLSRLISRSDRLETLIRAIRGLKPGVVVVAEVESEQNSPEFFTRFTETLFYYGASFDFLEVSSMRLDDTNRVVFEALCCGAAIRNVVAAEGEERLVRNVRVRVWRDFFERFGMEEIELSQASIEKAKLSVTRNLQDCGNSCTFEMDGKCLLMGWKGTPLHSLLGDFFTSNYNSIPLFRNII